MNKNFLRRMSRWAFLFALPLSALLSFQPTPSLKPHQNPLWWEIKLKLETQGKYNIEDRNALYSGSYSSTFLWRGSIERDNGDYILYHFSNELVQWEATETAKLPERIKILTTPDFIDKPSFKLNYVLRKEGNIYFDFIVLGFSVPQSNSSESFYLVFPSSKENSQSISDINYNFFVRKGSNQVTVEDSQIYCGGVKKNFNWTWKREQWLDKGGQSLLFSNSHEVKVTLTITPHQARG